MDTGAKCSIASQKLYHLLRKKGTKFQQKKMQIALADGHPRIRDVLTTKTYVKLEDRSILTEFIVLPGSKDNRTLLGVDFIDDAGLVIDVPQRSWNFVDAAETHFEFVPEPKPAKILSDQGEEGKIRLQAADAATMKEIAKFAQPPPPVLSPIKKPPNLAAYLEDEQEELIVPSTAVSRNNPTVWSDIDELFDRCLTTHETRYDVAAVEITVLRDDEATQFTPGERM